MKTNLGTRQGEGMICESASIAGHYTEMLWMG